MSIRRWPTCRRCSSDLAGRFAVRGTWRGKAADVYRCRCGARQYVIREERHLGGS